MPKYWGKQIHTREIPRSGSKAEDGENTPGTAGGPGGRDRTLAVKSRKNTQKSFFCIYLLVTPKYWGKQIFTHGRFPEGQKQKTERKERKKESKHGARKSPGPKEREKERKTERW